MSNFSFNDKNLALAQEVVKKYPDSREKSAIVPLLDMAQRQNSGWLSTDVMEYVANYLGMSYAKVYEIASFYSMFNLKPVGKYHVQVCGTTPCWLRGAKQIVADFEKILDVKCGGNPSDDGLFSLVEVECLGACINAPVAQINDDYYENLDERKIEQLVRELKK
jgi:NADH-quinone oxidoreductase subunit E